VVVAAIMFLELSRARAGDDAARAERVRVDERVSDVPEATPRVGVTRIGDVESASVDPEPVVVAATMFLDPSRARAGDEAVRLERVRVDERVNDVPEATPRVGVVRIGDVARTSVDPEPVVVAATMFLELSRARAGDEAVRLESVRVDERVSDVPEATPRVGVTRTGDVERTSVDPEPVVVAATMFLDPSRARAGDEDVRLERVRVDERVSDVPEATPRVGVTRTGDVDRTSVDPEPVVVHEMFGVGPPEEDSGVDAVTAVTVPLVAGAAHKRFVPFDVRIVPAEPTPNSPVPPLATGRAVPVLYDIANVPELVIGDPVIVRNEGVDRATEVTVPLVAGAAHERFVPFEVRIVPADPTANSPVPPLATGRAVPVLYDIANVPELVIGDPVIVRNEGVDRATEVTVPTVGVVHVGTLPAADVKTCPE
jgi:hypothetical protein